jgi:hypothetical protein
MSTLKKYLGIVWMLIAPIAVYFLVSQAADKLSRPTSTFNDWLQWGIIILIFLPIAVAFCIFGWYAWKGEYDTKSES